MRIVLDTNVLVSALLTPRRPAWKVYVRLVSGLDTPLVDERILVEYEEVLCRPRFDFDPEEIRAVIEFFRTYVITVPSRHLTVALPHASDAPFVEVALAGHAEALITGNVRHFPARAMRGVPVLTAARFLKELSRSESR